MVDQKLPSMPILNGKYVMLSTLGEGNTSKVYLAQTLEEPKHYVAIKILREEFLSRDEDSRKAVVNEVIILQTLKHPNIIKILEFGDNGWVLKPSGKQLHGLVYIVLELVQGGLLFDICQLVGGLGEEGGRYFFKQMLNSIDYMNSMKVSHRDLKLENILVDCDLTLKIADFGYASFQKVDNLSSYRGTFTYMAPEIKEGKQYNGLKVDLFSAGVILFILIRGIFPFKEARKEEFFYNMLYQGKYAEYWEKVQGNYLSDECRDLLQKLLEYDPEKRPTIDELKNHPWILSGPSDEEIKQQVIQLINDKKGETAESRQKSKTSQKKTKYTRGADDSTEPNVISDKPFVRAYKYNNFGEFLTEDTPSSVFGILENYKAEVRDDIDIEIEEDKKRISITDKAKKLKLSLKFYKLNQDEDESRLKMKFVKKNGELQDQYELINELMAYLNEVIIDDEEEDDEQ